MKRGHKNCLSTYSSTGYGSCTALKEGIHVTHFAITTHLHPHPITRIIPFNPAMASKLSPVSVSNVQAQV